MEMFKKSLVIIAGVTLIAGYADMFAGNPTTGKPTKRQMAAAKAQVTRKANAAKTDAQQISQAPAIDEAEEDRLRGIRFDEHKAVKKTSRIRQLMRGITRNHVKGACQLVLAGVAAAQFSPVVAPYATPLMLANGLAGTTVAVSAVAAGENLSGQAPVTNSLKRFAAAVMTKTQAGYAALKSRFAKKASSTEAPFVRKS